MPNFFIFYRIYDTYKQIKNSAYFHKQALPKMSNLKTYEQRYIPAK